MKDYYEILEVSRKASKDTINKVFKMHMKACHPDLFQGDEKVKAEEKSKEYTEAYNVLSDDNARAKYDEELKENDTNDENNYIIQTIQKENEYLKQVIAQKNEYIARLTGNYTPQNINDYDNASYTSQYSDNAQTYNQRVYGQRTEQNNPYENMTYEEIQQAKREEQIAYFKSKIKTFGIQILLFAILIIAILISIGSTLKDLNALFR